ncbi:MAG TPA: hypothetical protein VHH36_02305, partial [Candidatus Thermoplasmatota archaeon]|nr:hypothetical protein [Candidatus Thermoplasmatota archaeon]
MVPRYAPGQSSDWREEYYRLALKVFGRGARRAAERNDKLRHSLEQAHMDLLPEVFVASTWFLTIVTLAGGYTLVLLFLALGAALGLAPSLPLLAVLLVAPLLATGMAYVAIAIYPDYKAG